LGNSPPAPLTHACERLKLAWTEVNLLIAAASRAEPHRPSKKLKAVTLVSMSATLLSVGLMELSVIPLALALLD
jgi:hypothetical protein